MTLPTVVVRSAFCDRTALQRVPGASQRREGPFVRREARVVKRSGSTVRARNHAPRRADFGLAAGTEELHQRRRRVPRRHGQRSSASHRHSGETKAALSGEEVNANVTSGAVAIV